MTPRFGQFIALGMLCAAVVRAADAPANPVVPAQSSYTDAVAAIVNGEIITISQLKKQADPLVPGIFNELENKYPNNAEAAEKEFHLRLQNLQKELLHGMADRILIIQEFRDKKYSFPAWYLNQQFDDSITTRFQGDHKKYLEQLAANNMSEKDYRRQIEEDDIIQAMMQQLRSSVTGVSPDRIKAYYEKTKKDYEVKESAKVRQIALTPVADEPPELIQQQAAKIVQEARAPGANFAELAQKYSSDNAARNGNLPTYSYTRDEKSKLPPAIEAAVFSLKPGEVSDPVVSGNTTFIFKCEEKVSAGIEPLEKVRAQIEEKLVKEENDRATEKWLERLRSKAYILFNL